MFSINSRWLWSIFIFYVLMEKNELRALFLFLFLTYVGMGDIGMKFSLLIVEWCLAISGSQNISHMYLEDS